MELSLNIVETIYEDAARQLEKYDITVEEKIEDILEEYALEYRTLEIKKTLRKNIDFSIEKSDLRKSRLGGANA